MTNDTERLPEERQYQQELLTTLFWWFIVLVVALIPFEVVQALRRPAAGKWFIIAELLFSLALFSWAISRVRRGFLRAPTRAFLGLFVVGEFFFMLSTADDLRGTDVMSFALVILLAIALEPPRAALVWTCVAGALYTTGLFLPDLAGWPVRHSDLSERLTDRAVKLGELIAMALLGRSILRHFRRALARSESARQDLAQSQATLERQNSELQRFAYVISHDLRAPLRALTNYSRFLQEDCLGGINETCQQYIQGINESARHMDELVVDLLEYSRIERIKIVPTPVDLGALLDKVITTLHLRERADVSLPPNAPMVVARAPRLEQILAQLLDNAAKFHRLGARPRISVDWTDRGDAWELSVRDDGIGIDPKHFEKIFDVFQRLHSRDEYEGTGIGLAIVKKAVEEHGGRVWVESAPGQGSVFRFTLPKDIEVSQAAAR